MDSVRFSDAPHGLSTVPRLGGPACICRWSSSPRCFAPIAEHQKANESYISEGIELMELAVCAADQFERQSASRKRRLLKFVFSNSTWANGELTPQFRQPFYMIADMAVVSPTEKVVGGGTDQLGVR